MKNQKAEKKYHIEPFAFPKWLKPQHLLLFALFVTFVFGFIISITH